jgi:multisubunit Na+/H+ antiporter MnhB subunit
LQRVLGQAFDVLGQVAANVFRDAEPANLSSLQLETAETWGNVSGLVGRLWEWSLVLLTGMPYYDPVAITVLWGLSIWGVVTWAMWYLFRRNQPFAAFIPSISLVAIALALGGETSYNLAFMFGATIILMAFANHDTHERRWLRERLAFTETIRARIISIAGLLTIGLVVFSLLTPSISFDFMADFARKMTGTDPSDTELAQSLGIQNQGGSQEADILDLRREGGLPNDHLIGSSPKLSEQVVMVVRVETAQSGIPEDQLTEALSPLYLRSLVYDRYIGSGWASRDTKVEGYKPGDLIPSADENARPVRQQVQFVEDLGGLMYTLGTPLSADQDFRVAWRLQSGETGVYDIFGATVEGETYRADSLMQIHSIDELRTAGQNYPGWLISRYMSLPETVPENVLTLARDLTATQTNPFDRAVAIENYLRQFPYNLNVSTGPAGADIVEYFLFNLQEGYCDYYASAMVVLARAAGMPARYVVGYIGEHYDESLDAYVITADQAHAWAEIYFPEYGWIQFEPTGGRPAIERPPEALPELPEDFELDFSPLVPEKRFSFDNGPLIFWTGLLLVVIVILAGWNISDWWLARMPVEKGLPRLYRRLFRYGHWMHLPTEPGVTPFEFSYFLSQHLKQLASGSHWADWLLQGESLLRQVTTAYVQITFNPSSGSTILPHDIMAAYKKLRLRLWVLWFMGRIYKYWVLRPLFWTEAPLFISSFVEEDQ